MHLLIAPLLLSLGLLCLMPMAQAACQEPIFTPPDQVRLTSDTVLIVTHATSAHDPRFSTKFGVDTVIDFAKSKNIPVIYLVDEGPLRQYFMGDCEPTYWVKSIDGEVLFNAPVQHIYLAGGHVELCLSRSVHDLIYQAAKRPFRRLELTYVMDAIYSNGKTISESDPFYKDFSWFLGIIAHGRPGGEQWPKLNLLEATGVIKTIENDYRYLSELLPHWERTFGKDHRIELQMNNLATRVLQAGAGFRPPTVKFHFIDSADLLQ
ncbi:MAG: hypothetical protein FGM18_00195 [Burkholderiaceae bacterium]|nr:hypothetical protein [Burkholderiaceae bacterium]